MSFEHKITMLNLTCWTCGIEYAAPARWVASKMEDDEPVYCPNAHENQYQVGTSREDSAKLKADNERLRCELAQAIHHADQAAAARDAGREPRAEPDAPDAAAKPPDGPASTPCKCTRCNATFKGLTWVKNHMRRVHKMNADEIGAELIARRDAIK